MALGPEPFTIQLPNNEVWFLIRGLDGKLWAKILGGNWRPLGGALGSGPSGWAYGLTGVFVMVRGADGYQYSTIVHAGTPDNGAVWAALGGQS